MSKRIRLAPFGLADIASERPIVEQKQISVPDDFLVSERRASKPSCTANYLIVICAEFVRVRRRSFTFVVEFLLTRSEAARLVGAALGFVLMVRRGVGSVTRAAGSFVATA